MSSSDETRPPVAANEIFGEHRIVPLPEGTSLDAAFVMIKLSNGDWCARSVGDHYNRLEFLGSLSSYVEALTNDEARGWDRDDDDEI